MLQVLRRSNRKGGHPKLGRGCRFGAQTGSPQREVQAAALGCETCARGEDGALVVDQVGELVIHQPMPRSTLTVFGSGPQGFTALWWGLQV